MEKVDILVNATFIHEKPTGLGVYTRELTETLIARGRGVKAIAPEFYCRENPQIPTIKAPNFIAPGKGFINNVSRIIWLQFKLSKILKKYGQIALFSTVPEGIFFPPKEIKQVITIHDILPLLYPEEYPRIKHYMKYLLPILVQNSTKIVSVSENTKKDLIEYYKVREDKIVVIHPGVDLKVFNPGIQRIEKQTEYILYVGALRRYKNLLNLIKAMERLKSFDIKLIVVGDDKSELYKELFNYVKGHDLVDRIVFLGYVDRSTLVNLYRGAVAFVFPSLHEGFGLPAIEAMACGCPVIASNRASIPEVCGDSALYFDPQDVNDIASKISMVIKDKNLRRSLISKGLERAKLYTWERSADQLLRLLTSML